MSGAKTGVAAPLTTGRSADLTQRVKTYWENHIHDVAVVRHPPGTPEFFAELAEYRFDKQRYLFDVIDFAAYGGRELLEVGCGVGIDLVEFSKRGARVTGVDLSRTAIDLAKVHFDLRGVSGRLQVMDGERLAFATSAFDVVYAHGVLPYTANVHRMLDEIHRVLKPGGEAILQVYNRRSWLYALSKVMKTRLEHEDSPAFHVHTQVEFRRMLSRFAGVRLTMARFPVKTRLHRGLKGILYNAMFVGCFNAIPRPLVQGLGWHIVAHATK